MANNSKGMHPHWRPNFNNPATLPDIKVVRTNFLVNFVAVAAAVIAVFFALQREYTAFSLNQSIERMTWQIDSTKSADASSLKLSKKFKDAAESIVDLESFFAHPILVQDLIVAVSTLRPEGLIFKSVNYSEKTTKVGGKTAMTYAISLSGEVKDPLLLGEFKTILQEAEFFQFPGLECVVNESIRGRDTNTGIFPYQITIEIAPEPTTKKKAAR